ncbi:MAG: hypothetical protein KVP17_003589 [Porospora cf. gigantea B]|uniref:uncharacterized protein n=1 Tax=Porospora cf. gigantea B TaxID=2853592 RepID=UPI0035719EBD|nr:MAG: hypothetical protein KVP17_003589 [Porospora cf. gigantea B]
MESLKYNDITITAEEAPKAAKKIQLTKKTGVTSKLPNKRLPKDRTRRGLAVSCLQPGILSIDTLLLWMKIGLCFPFELPLMTELRRLLASVHGQLSKLSQALQICPPELGPQVYALSPNSSLAWLSHMNLPGLQPRLVKSRAWPGRLGAVNVQAMMAWFKKEGSRVCRALTMDLRGDPTARPSPLALPGLGEPLTSALNVSSLWWCKRVDEPEVRVVCGALLFSLAEVKQLVRMLEKQSVMEEISTAVSWDDSRCVWTTSLSCQAIENILQRAPDDAGSVPALEHLKMTQRNIQRFRDELRSLKTKIESRKTPKLDLSDLEQWLQAAARLPEGSLKSDEKKVLSETLDRGRETEEQLQADVATGDLRQIRTTLAAVQLLPFTSLKLRECIEHVGHLEAWRREFQQLSAQMVANPLASEDRSTKLKKKRKESKYGGYVVLSGQSGFVSDLRKAPVEEPGKDKRFTQNVMIDSGVELLHKAEEIALASTDVETLREWIQQSSDWRKRASQICSTGVVVPAVDRGDIACRLATLAEEISAYREVPFAVDDGTLFAELSNLYETYRAVELELDSEERKTVTELSTMVATIEAFYGQKISAENSDVDPRISAIVVRCERCSLWSDLADQCLLTMHDMRALCDGAVLGPVPYYPRSFPFDGDDMADNIESLLRTLYLRADDAPAVRLPLVVLYLVLFLQMSCNQRQGHGELISQKLPSLQQSIECALADYVADIDCAAQKLGACFSVPKDSFGIKFAETQVRNVEVAVISAWLLMDFPSAAAAVEINTTVPSLAESLTTSDSGLQAASFVRSLGNYLEEHPPFFSSLRLLVESTTWTIRAENLLSRSELSELQDAQDVGQLLSEPLGPGQESLRSALSGLCQDVQQWLLRLQTVYTFDYHPSTWSLSSINPLACHPGVPAAVSVQMPPARVDVLATNNVGARAELVSAALDMRVASPGSSPLLAYSLGDSDVRPLMGCIRAAMVNFAAPLSPCVDSPMSDEAMASFHALSRSQHDEFDIIVAHSPRLLRENLVGEPASQACSCGGTCLMCCTIVAIFGAIYRRRSLLWLDDCCSLLSSLYSSGGSEELYEDLLALNMRLDGLIACIQATQARLPTLADRIAASVLLENCDPRVSLGGWLGLEGLLLEMLTEEARQALSETVNPTTLPFTVWTSLWCQPLGARVSSDGFCLPRNKCSNPFSSVELTLSRVVSSAMTQLATSSGDLQSLAMSLLPSELSSTSFAKTVAVWNVGSEEYVFELSTVDGAIFIHFLTMAILVAIFDSREFSAEGIPTDPPELPEKLTALMTFARWRVQAACCYLDLERSPCLPHDVLQAECVHGRELLSQLLSAVEQSCVITELFGNAGARQLCERLPPLLSQCFELQTLGFRQSRTIEILSNYVQRATEKKKVPLSELTAVASRVLGECGVLHPSVESLQLFLEDMQAWAVESDTILQRLQGVLSMEKDGDDDGHRVLLNTNWDVCPDAVVSRLSVLAVRSREMGCILREDRYASLAGRIVNLERSLSTMGQQVDCGGDLTFDRASQHLADILSTFGLSRVSPLSHLGPFLPEESRRVLLRMKMTLEAWKSAERVFREVLNTDSLVPANIEDWLTTLAAAMRTLIPPLPDSSDPPSTGYTLTQKHMLILLRLTWSVVLRAAVVVGNTSGLQVS